MFKRRPYTYIVQMGIVSTTLKTSVADPERFDADPAPAPDADPNPCTRVRIFFLQIFNYCFQSLSQ